MENLEKYIQNNLGQFNTGEMPVGHQERFKAKLQAAQGGAGTDGGAQGADGNYYDAGFEDKTNN